MSGYEFDEIDKDYATAREGLHNALENLDYVDYALDSAPLTFGALAQTQHTREKVHAVVAEFGWPSKLADSLIEPVQNFPSNRAFLNSLKPINPIEGEAGPLHIASGHFFNLISVLPIDEPQEAKRGIDLSGLYPVVHRAHAVAPDFFGNLAHVLNKLRERYSIVGETDFLYEELLKPQNDEVVEAMHMAYRIMGRLIKVDDSSTIVRNCRALRRGDNSEVDEPPILSADVHLRYES